MTSQEGLSLPFLNLIKNNDVDWDDNCIFENGKVTGFKRDLVTNNYRMRPIPRGDKAINDAKEAAKILDVALRPATPNQIAVAVKKLSLHCGMQAKAPEEVKYMFQDYCNDLGKYPIQLIEDACAQYRQLPEGNNFMPSSGTLISMMNEKYHKMQFLKVRIDKILGTHVEIKRENRTLSLNEALNQLVNNIG